MALENGLDGADTATPARGRQPLATAPGLLLAPALADVGGQGVHQDGQRLLLGASLGRDVVLDGRRHPLAGLVLIDLDLESHGHGLATSRSALITARS